MFNSENYAHADVAIRFFDGTSLGVQAIKYKVSRAKKNVHTIGADPTGRVRGKKDYEGSVTVTLGELFQIEELLEEDEDITDIKPFLITVSYANQEDGMLRTKKLTYCEFTEAEVSSESSSDDEITVELPLIIGPIKNS